VWRVLVIGSGGSGKSTLAAQLGERLGLPVIHLDREYWRTGWNATPSAEWGARVDELVRGDRWIMDGNYGGTLDQRLAASDTVIFLDLPRLTCVRRVVTRWLRFRGRSRPDMARDCPEHLTWEFVRWIWTYPTRRRGDVLARLAAVEGHARVIVLRSPREVRRFVESMPARSTSTEPEPR
jgi:adenylate kinase family enzyme